MSDLGQWLFQKQQEAIKLLVDRSMPRTGVVDTLTNTGLTVIDPLTGDAESELLIPLGMRPDAAGSRVVILPLADGSRVVLPLGVTAAARRYGAFTVIADSQVALRVIAAADGLNRIVMDTVTPQLELWNGTDLAIYSDNGSTLVGKWDAGTGTITSGSIISSDIRGIFPWTVVDSSPTTATNASITTYVEAANISLTFPTGSAWSYQCGAIGIFKNNTANDGARMYIDFAGDTGTSQGVTNPTANANFSVLASSSGSGKSGAVTIRTMYRAETGGTATAQDQLVWFTAYRTAA